jgi:hypothetical protein
MRIFRYIVKSIHSYFAPKKKISRSLIKGGEPDVLYKVDRNINVDINYMLDRLGFVPKNVEVYHCPNFDLRNTTLDLGYYGLNKPDRIIGDTRKFIIILSGNTDEFFMFNGFVPNSVFLPNRSSVRICTTLHSTRLVLTEKVSTEKKLPHQMPELELKTIDLVPEPGFIG